jgi:hypothetical protein
MGESGVMSAADCCRARQERAERRDRLEALGAGGRSMRGPQAGRCKQAGSLAGCAHLAPHSRTAPAVGLSRAGWPGSRARARGEPHGAPSQRAPG